MKYTRYIVFFLFINLIIVFLSIFIGNLSRKTELINNLIQEEIINYKEQLKINKIEFSFYNNPDYLKKLHNIYFSLEEDKIETKVVSIIKFLNIPGDSLILVDLKSDLNAKK